MDFAQVIKDRYSCKKYDGKPVTAEQLSSILEAGRLAPTAKNLQEQHIYVVQSAEGLDKIDKLTPCRYGAPLTRTACSPTPAASIVPVLRMPPSWPPT